MDAFAQDRRMASSHEDRLLRMGVRGLAPALPLTFAIHSFIQTPHTTPTK